MTLLNAQHWLLRRSLVLAVFSSEHVFASWLTFVVVAVHRSHFISFCLRVRVCEALQVYLIVLWYLVYRDAVRGIFVVILKA